MDVSNTQQTSKAYRRFALFLLTLIYAFNFIDRQIIGIVSPFIQADLGLTNTQLGLLKGLLFAALYTLVGIPIAWLADRYSRVNILSASLAIWSGFTALTGMASSFLTIGFARMGVGIGEAGGSPPSHSIISDLYPKEERAGALGIYSIGIPLGLGCAYLLTGWLLGDPDNAISWRKLLIILGVIGIALSIFTRLIIREPKRGAQDNVKTVSDEFILPIPTLIKNIGASRKFWIGLLTFTGLSVGFYYSGLYIRFIISFISLAVITYSIWTSKSPFAVTIKTLLSIKSWWAMCLGIAFASFTAYAVSTWQVDYLLPFDGAQDSPYGFRKMMYILAFLNCVIYGAGTYFGGWFTQKLARKSVKAYGLVPAISILICLPLLILTFWSPSSALHLTFGGGLLFFIGMYLGPSFAVAQTLAPINMRAMSTALFFLVLNMIALGGGPTVAGILTDMFEPAHGKVHAIRLSLTWTSAAFILSAISFFIAAKTLPQDWEDAQARNQAIS